MIKKEKVYKRIVVTDSNLVKVSKESPKYLYGYDIFKEEFVAIEKKNTTYMDLPKVMLDMIKSECNLAKLALIIGSSRKESSDVLGMSERNFYRIVKNNNLDFEV